MISSFFYHTLLRCVQLHLAELLRNLYAAKLPTYGYLRAPMVHKHEAPAQSRKALHLFQALCAPAEGIRRRK